MKFKSYIIFLIVALVTVAFIWFIYDVLSQVTPGADLNLQARKIETTTKLILNGYLGAFFAFNYLGNINWLLIPLALIYYFVAKPKITRIHVAFIFLIVFALVLIGLKGFFNPRYAFTLLPLLVFLVFELTWKTSKLLNTPILRYASLVFLIGLISWNFYREAISIRFTQKVSEIMVESDDKATLVSNSNDAEVLDVMEFINDMSTTDYFLVDNAPEFYYHTSKKGHYYWNGDDLLYMKNGRTKLIEGKSLSEISDTLENDLSCKYIFSYSTYRGYNTRFDEYLSTKCKLIAFDKDYRQLYQIVHEN
uniref:hypothetical protein n=1 Tax=Flavobacterium sp. TaxID=239 RepID=UPI00404B44D6